MTDRGYARISLDNERSGSITKQKTRIGRFADEGVVWYVDESVSGAKVRFADRPEGGRLLADLKQGDRLLVTKIDRAARNVRDLLDLVERVEKAGAAVVFIDQNIDTSGPMGRFLLTLLGAVAELEAAIVGERARETRESFREEGRFGGGPVPFGLQTVPNPRGRGVVLRPYRGEDGELTGPSATAREIVARVLAGEAQRALAPLAGYGEPGFSRWLRNPALAGIRPGAELEVDPEAAVFSLVEWQALQDYLKRPAKAWTKADGYGAALACGVCGERLYFRKDRRYPESSVYACRRAKHAPGEPSVAVVRRHADAHVEDEFLRAFGRLPVIEEVTVSSSAERAEAIARARLRLDAVRKAQDASTSPEEDERIDDDYRAARRALRAAEALPETSTTETRPTGLTFAQTWDTADDSERSALLRRVGPWVVSPGRGLPIAEKVRREETHDYASLVDYIG